MNIVVRDVRERARDIEGCIKQWFAYVKPNFEKVRLFLILDGWISAY